MKKTQRLIIILGDSSQEIRNQIAGFHACTVISNVTEETLKNVFHFNKNAVYFSKTYDFKWKKYHPLIIRLSDETDIYENTVNIQAVIEDFPKILNANSIDSGDHSSHDSTGMSCASTKKCLLCRIETGEKSDEHVLFNSKNFYVVPGKGAFFDGYLMIVPKRHIMSFAQLNASEFNEFVLLLNDLKIILEGIYNQKVFAFECGSGKDGSGKHETSIVHAHFHLAVTDMPVLKEVQKSGLYPAQINKQDLLRYSDHPYMLYIDQEDNWYISGNPETYFPRQHPRQVLAEYMGMYDEYNWRVHPFTERMEVIANEFRNFCKENFNYLPLWMRNCIQFED